MVKSNSTVAVILGIVSAGVLLQLTVGNFPLLLISKPISIFLIFFFPIVSVILSFLRRYTLCKWLTDTKLTIGLLTSLLTLCIIMGFGWWSITRSWPFVLIYASILISLGCVVFNKIIYTKNFKDFSFIINHLGIYIVFLFAGVGYADIRKYTMEVTEGTLEWRGFDESGKMEELPLAIQLNKFEMSFHEMSTVPSSFISDIELYTKKGEKLNGQISVNSPLNYSNWKIYQYSYDSSGIHRVSSTFLLVYDPWLGFVYVGFAIMAAGAFLMIIGKYGKSSLE